jgi:hypothetical protein
MFYDIMNTEKARQSVDWSDFAGKESVLKAERDRREPFTTTFLNSADSKSMNTNINTIQTLETTTNNNVNQLLSAYTDISNNIQSYMTTQEYLHTNNAQYHYDDQMPPDVILKREPPNNINSVLEKDLNTMNLYQNSIYISSAIACATLLIAAIIIVPLQKNS